MPISTIFVEPASECSGRSSEGRSRDSELTVIRANRCPPQQLHVRWRKSGSQQVSQYEPGLPGHTFFYTWCEPAKSYGRTINSRRTWNIQLCCSIRNEQGGFCLACSNSLVHLLYADFLSIAAQVFMQGSIDHEGALNGRFNYGWSDSDITKVQANVRHFCLVSFCLAIANESTSHRFKALLWFLA